MVKNWIFMVKMMKNGEKLMKNDEK